MISICKGTKKDGTPCHTQTVKGERYCFYHNPEKQERVHLLKGGPELPKARPNETVLPDFQLEKIAEMVSEKLEAVLSRKLDALVKELCPKRRRLSQGL